MTDVLNLAKDIINGKQITKDYEHLHIFYDSDLEELMEGANLIRKFYVGDYVDLCSILNAKSGKCSEDCKFCAQSVHNKTNVKVYDFLDEDEILNAAADSAKNKVDRFCLVTAGKSLTGKEFEKAVKVIEKIKLNCDVKICASMGFLEKDQLKKIFKAGVTTFHCNIETSKENFKNICTTHSFDMKVKTIKMVKEIGMRACSGGIFGMGETFADRVNMALILSELLVDSIPINILIKINGTPFENKKIKFDEEDLLRTVAMFRYINPKADVRLAAGRKNLTNFGEKALKSGANSMISGNMLTTTINSTVFQDKVMLKEIGRATKQ